MIDGAKVAFPGKIEATTPTVDIDIGTRRTP